MLTHVKPFALITAAAIAFTSVGLAPAHANPVGNKPTTAQGRDPNAVPVTDFSARRRSYGYYGYRRNNAAAIGTFLAIAGGVAAIAAARSYRRHYYGSPYGYYGGGPYYGYGAPYGYYGPRSYRYGW
ncbi:MAG: hypothetical protein ACXWJW_02725 [Xanthobacteraceae bacterium]